MSVFIDTGLFYALQNRRAEHHDDAKAALATVQTGRFGRPYTSEYVFDEAVTLVRAHRDFREARVVANRILGAADFPAVYEVLWVTEDGFEAAMEAFDRYRDHSLSFTDATTVALMADHDVDQLLSFDDDFDGIVDRLAPGELR
jgi:predicted nucleic acid-binding protein